MQVSAHESKLYQAAKLWRITLLIASRYAQILSPRAETREFFTDIYTRYCVNKTPVYSLANSTRTLPSCDIEMLFPGINEVSIQTFATLRSHRTGEFSAQAGHLTSPFENYALCAVVKFLEPKVVFEFGTYKGWTAANLSLNAPSESQTITLDIEIQDSGDAAVDRIFAENKIKRIIADSATFDFSQLHGQIDFLFIDGDHSAEGVKRDTENALKMLSPIGTIVWHDYNADHPGVLNYLNSLATELPIQRLASTCLALYSRNPRLARQGA